MKPFKDTVIQILRWSEQYTKTDMVYLAKGGGILGLGQLVASLAGFLTAILFANFVPKETYGVYKFVLSTTALLSIPTLTGMGVAVTRAIARGFEGTLLQALKSKLVWGMLGSIGGLVLSGYYYSQDNLLLAIAFFVVALFLPVMEMFGVYDSFLQGKKEFGLSVKYATISKTTSILALITTTLFTDNLVLLLFAYFVPLTLSRFFFFRHTEKKLKTNDVRDADAITFGKHLSAIGILGTIANQLDKILIFNLLGPVELAAYAVTTAPIEQVKALLDNISRIALPKFSQQTTATIRHTIWRRIFLLLVLLGLVTTVYWFIAPVVFTIFFRQYAEFSLLSQIFGLSIITFALFIPIQILQSQQDTRSLYLFNTSFAGVKILSTTLGIYYFGLPGAIFAWVATRFFGLATSFLLLHRKLVS